MGVCKALEGDRAAGITSLHAPEYSHTQGPDLRAHGDQGEYRAF